MKNGMLVAGATLASIATGPVGLVCLGIGAGVAGLLGYQKFVAPKVAAIRAARQMKVTVLPNGQPVMEG